MKEARTVKGVSFSHDNDYEVELYAFATDPARGKFSNYVKRLIDRDRAQLIAPAMPSVPIVPDALPAPAKVGKTVAKSFL